MCSSSPPAAPDYVGAANATASSDAAAQERAIQASRTNQYTPQGSLTWHADQNAPSGYSSVQSLTPVGQQTNDINQSTQLDLANIGHKATSNIGDILSTPFSTSQFGAIPTGDANRQKVMDAMLSRVNSQNASDVDAARSKLVAAGIPMDSKAYQSQMAGLGSRLTDARQQAEIAANSQAQQTQQMNLDARRQGISEALLNRQTPLNEINSLRTGAQVQQPTFQNYGTIPSAGGANLLGAAQAQGAASNQNYATQQAQNNAAMSGLFSLGSAYLSS